MSINSNFLPSMSYIRTCARSCQREFQIFEKRAQSLKEVFNSLNLELRQLQYSFHLTDRHSLKQLCSWFAAETHDLHGHGLFESRFGLSFRGDCYIFWYSRYYGAVWEDIILGWALYEVSHLDHTHRSDFSKSVYDSCIMHEIFNHETGTRRRSIGIKSIPACGIWFIWYVWWKNVHHYHAKPYTAAFLRRTLILDICICIVCKKRRQHLDGGLREFDDDRRDAWRWWGKLLHHIILHAEVMRC